MKDLKNCNIRSCCWDHRHELLGLILLVIATLLTLATHNSCGVIALFIAGVVLCCYRSIACHSHGHCHCPCHEHENACSPCVGSSKEDENPAKKSSSKAAK